MRKLYGSTGCIERKYYVSKVDVYVVGLSATSTGEIVASAMKKTHRKK